MPTSTWIHIGQPRPASTPAGRSHTAASAATEARNQLVMNDSAVKLRFAVRRAYLHGFARNIGTAVSIKAAAAITVRITLTLVRKARSDIGPPVSQPS